MATIEALHRVAGGAASPWESVTDKMRASGAEASGGLDYLSISDRLPRWQSPDERAELSQARYVTRCELAGAGREPMAHVAFWPGGLSYKRRSPGPMDAKGAGVGGTRGEIRGFSLKSRQRMLERLMRIDWGAGACYFTTLTYHRSCFDKDREDWKRDLQTWRKRLERKYSKTLCGVLWRLEFQPRKSGEHRGQVAPHFHCIVFFDRQMFLPSLRDWVAESWHAIADPMSAEHAKAGTNVERARNVQGEEMGRLLSYLAKYVGKLEKYTVIDRTTGEIMSTGRTWGLWGDVPMAVLGAVRMDQSNYRRFLERVNAKGSACGSWYMEAISEQWEGFRIWGDGGLLMDELLQGIDVVVLPGLGAPAREVMQV